MRSSKKHIIWILPIIIALILFGLQYIYQIQSEVQLPNKGWSRTIHLPVQTKEGKQYVYADQNAYYIYTYTNKTITYSKLNKNLDLISQKKYDFPDSIAHIYWGRGDQFIYKGGLDVYYFNGETSVLLAKDTGPTITDGKAVYYAKDKEIYKVDVKTKAAKEIGTFQFPVQTLYLGTDHNLLLTTQDIDKNWAYFYFLKQDQNGIHSYRFAKYLLGENAHMSQNTAFIQHDGKVGLYFTVSVAKGGLSYLQYYMNLPYEKLETHKTVEFNPAPISIFQSDGNTRMGTPTDIDFTIKNGQPTLLFEAEGFRTKRDNAVNIYEAQPNAEGKWVANRRSTTTDSSISPFWLGNDAIAWYAYTKQGVFKLEATSHNPLVVSDSLKLRNEDFSTAFSNSLLAIFRVFYLILISAFLGLGAIFIYVIISFTKVEWIDNDVPAVKWAMIAAFFLGEIWVAHHVMSSMFEYYAPGYLTFTGNAVIIPVLVAALSLFLTSWLKNRKAGTLSYVSTFAIYYLVIMSFLIGPYYF